MSATDNAMSIAYSIGESRQAALVGLQIFLFSLAFISCTLRIYSRVLIVRSFGVDDYVMILATVLSLGGTINSCIGAGFGWGKHITDVPKEDFSNALLSGWLAEVFITFTTATVKISILIFYLRLAVTKTYATIIYLSIAWITMWMIAFLAVIIFQCHPIDAFWHPSVDGLQNPACFDAEAPLFVCGITNMANDLFVFFLPMPVLWKVQLPRKQRIGLMALFGIGALVCVAGALRLYYTILSLSSTDVTWLGYQMWTWSSAEVNLGIVCACVPALKPLLVRWFPRIMDCPFGRSGHETHSRPTKGGQGTLIAMNSNANNAGSRDCPKKPNAETCVYGNWSEYEAGHTSNKDLNKTKDSESTKSLV